MLAKNSLEKSIEFSLILKGLNYFLKKDFIYLRGKEHERGEGQREKQLSPPTSGEPDAGL